MSKADRQAVQEMADWVSNFASEKSGYLVEIRDLKAEVETLKNEVADAYDKGEREGYEAAKRGL